MKLKLGFFYYDLMNLYGDSGNVTILAHHLAKQGIEVTVDRLSLSDPKDIASYDWIYMGSGIERSMILALTDIRKYKDQFAEAIENGTHILATGNSFELFGKEIRMPSKSYKGLGLLDFSTEYKIRTVHDLLIPYGEHQLVGFENHSGQTIENNETPFLSGEDRTEGVKKKNLIGTYTIGPLLVRNPFFLKEYMESILKKKEPSYQMKPMDLALEDAAYASSLKAMTEMHLT